MAGKINDIFSNIEMSHKFKKGFQENDKAIKVPLTVVIVHELGHANDAILEKALGCSSMDKFTTIYVNNPYNSSKSIHVPESEVNAMYWENVARIHNNLPIRIKYGIDNNSRYYTGDGAFPKFENKIKDGAIIGLTIKDLRGNSKDRGPLKDR